MLAAGAPEDAEVDEEEDDATFDRASCAFHVRERAKMRLPMLSTGSAGVPLPKPPITSTKSFLL